MMMKINNVTLKNFKVHHQLNFSFEEKNCLIYGENGSGKSSIYWALHSLFYYYKGIKEDIRNTYLHRKYKAESLAVDIKFNNNSKISRRDDDVSENIADIRNQNIYLIDEKELRKIINHDFYEVLQNTLQFHFPQLKLLFIYREIERKCTNITSNSERKELIQQRINADNEFKTKITTLIPYSKINNIIQNHFNQSFEISFTIKDSSIDTDNIFTPPKILIKIKDEEDNGDLLNHFNEGKLKLIGIAIYFALAKHHEIPESTFNLLILDDFMTSLDMANRKLVIQYILKEFESYQIIILTHNIQFFNLINKLLNLNNINEEWLKKKIFIRKKENIEESIIYNQSDDFITKAESALHDNDLDIAGNSLRKEFERLQNELKIILELGKVEKLSQIFESLLNSGENDYFENSHQFITKIDNKLEKIQTKLTTPSSEHWYNFVPSEIKAIQDLISDKKIGLSYTRFYQSILMHPLSHNDSDTEIFRSECERSLELVKDLKAEIEIIKDQMGL